MKIIPKYCIFFLTALLIFPAVVNFAHAFAGHEHNICQNEQQTHFHKENPECELFKFQQNPYPEIGDLTFVFIATEAKTSVIISDYPFVNSYKKLSYSLRGPPVFSIT